MKTILILLIVALAISCQARRLNWQGWSIGGSSQTGGYVGGSSQTGGYIGGSSQTGGYIGGSSQTGGRFWG